MGANLNLGWCCKSEVFQQCSIISPSIVASCYFCIKYRNTFYIIFLKEISCRVFLQNIVTGFWGSLFPVTDIHNTGVKEAFYNLSVKNLEYIYNRFSLYDEDRH